MKLAEIVVTAAQAGEPTALLDKFKDELTFVKDISSTLKLYRSNNNFAMKRDEEILAWVSFKDKTEIVKSETYYVLQFIYIAPELRGKWGAGMFIIALKEELEYPLILGSKADSGGVLFKDGSALVKAFSENPRFTTHVLNLDTGEKQEYDGDIKKLNGKHHLTIMIESDGFPLVHSSTGLFIFEGIEELDSNTGTL